MPYIITDGPVLTEVNILHVDENRVAHLDNGQELPSMIVFRDMDIAKAVLYRIALKQDSMNPPVEGIKAADLDITEEWADLVFDSH